MGGGGVATTRSHSRAILCVRLGGKAKEHASGLVDLCCALLHQSPHFL